MAARGVEGLPKVFGVGMSKTGTTTLARCFQVLGLEPRKGFDARLKRLYERSADAGPILEVARRYRSFEDSPWYMLYAELDRAFPGSKFVLTLRAESDTHARSSWAHTVRAGVRRGEPTADYLAAKKRIYETHNRAVREHFRNRPDALLEVCWERGDGWEQLCPFLGMDVPAVPFPHLNPGRAPSAAWLGDSPPQMWLRRLRYAVARAAGYLSRS